MKSVITKLWLVATLPAVSAFCVPKVSQRRAFACSKPLFSSIMDEVNSDAFDLTKSSSSGDAQSSDMAQFYENLLAELVFSSNDPRVDIANNFDTCTDEAWLAWLERKIENSRDPEERTALRDLCDTALDIKKKVELSKLAEERMKKEAEEEAQRQAEEADLAAQEGRSMSGADILRKASTISNAEAGHIGVQKKEEEEIDLYEIPLTPEIRASYGDLLKKVLPPYKKGESPESVIYNYYDQLDAQFVKLLTEQVDNGDEDSRILLDALASEQSKRMSAAAESLKAVVSLGDPMRMEGALIKLAKEGKIDEPFLLLLEANAQQARDAGANGPAQLMTKLKRRAMEEKDKQSASKEIELLRKLLRTDDSTEREKLLEKAFTPKEALIVPGTAENAERAMSGEVPEEQKPLPDVPPPDFINACKAVLLNFGNIGSDDDRGDLASRIKQIAAEAEVVAVRIYGKSMSVREQQDRAWKEETTSIFDLEHLEIEAERRGEQAPWTNPDADDDMIPGFDAQGRMKIGGT
mmetsp:Transcript_17470/g.26723  ORF Transcript_17470/g.26723 Transcript_17470/m.26723 type:complete len:523 (-) Transcript_17470:40-1608(-)